MRNPAAASSVKILVRIVRHEAGSSQEIEVVSRLERLRCMKEGRVAQAKDNKRPAER
jgi:hypothetical protein